MSQRLSTVSNRVVTEALLPSLLQPMHPKWATVVPRAPAATVADSSLKTLNGPLLSLLTLAMAATKAKICFVSSICYIEGLATTQNSPPYLIALSGATRP